MNIINNYFFQYSYSVYLNLKGKFTPESKLTLSISTLFSLLTMHLFCCKTMAFCCSGYISLSAALLS